MKCNLNGIAFHKGNVYCHTMTVIFFVRLARISVSDANSLCVNGGNMKVAVYDYVLGDRCDVTFFFIRKCFQPPPKIPHVTASSFVDG